MISRRKFLSQALLAGASASLFRGTGVQTGGEVIITVNGPIRPADLQVTLTHEHVLVDFIGAGKVNRERYNEDVVFNAALPRLKDLKGKGCGAFVDCTPNYLGRNATLLKRLSQASGLQIITNTGYYGAAGEKYLPAHAYTESAEELASRWVAEFSMGIDGTGIRPGFIKSGVDRGPLSAVQRKIIEAAAITHLKTGLTIGVHTGDGMAAREQLEILKANGVSAAARIWIHAQNEINSKLHIDAAQQGSWVSFDGVNAQSLDGHIGYLHVMKAANLLDHVLVSQDSGWYHVGEAGGGKFNDYNFIFTDFIPSLRKQGFTEPDIQTLFISNPARAFTIGIRKT